MRTRSRLITLVVACAITWFARAAWSGDAPAPLDPEQKKAVAEVRRRATQWMEWRRKLVIDCPDCEGSGQRLILIQGRSRATPCGKCAGRGKRFSKEATWKVMHEFRTPEWRSRPGASRESERLIQELRYEDAPILAPTPWKLVSVELVDADHAIARTVEGERKNLVETPWVRSIDSVSKASSWFVFTPDADGPWPACTEASVERQEPLPLLQGAFTDKALESLKLTFALAERSRAGRRLLLAFASTELPPESSNPESLAAREAILIVKAIYTGMPSDWDAVQMTFSGICQNKFGERQTMPFLRTSLDIETFRRIKWENLTESEVFQLFVTERVVPEGWTLVVR